jgi:cell division protein FtsB
MMRRALWAAAAVGAIAFAIEGGEFGTSDIYSQKARRARMRAEVDSLQATVDSLRAELKSINTDEVRLERIARERYGMVKGSKEVLYRVSRSGDGSADRATATARDSVVASDTSRARPRG